MIGETCENTNKIYSKKNLKHYLRKYYKDEMDYQQYKEKVIDYEVVIDENNEVALEIIKQKLIVKEDDLKPAITLIIYNHYRKYLDYNLRLLQKVILQINYFYKECFSKLYKKEESKIFLDALNITYDALFRNLKSYYINKTEDFDFPNYKKYLNNVLILDFLSLNELKEYFANNLKQATFDYFHQIYLDYTLSRLSSYDFAQRINHDLEVLKKYIFKENKLEGLFWIFMLFKNYKKIIGIENHYETIIIYHYIENYIQMQLENEYLSEDDSNIKVLKNEVFQVKNYEEYYIYMKKRKEKEKCKNIEYFFLNNAFSSDKIKYYNNFNIDVIVEFFEVNNEFYNAFMEFGMQTYADNIYKKDYDNNIFKAFLIFINKDPIKKEAIEKLLNNEKNTVLYHVLGLKNN